MAFAMLPKPSEMKYDYFNNTITGGHLCVLLTCAATLLDTFYVGCGVRQHGFKSHLLLVQ